MQKDISTNIHIPEDLWRAIKIRAAEEGTSMKQLILEGISIVLKKRPARASSGSGRDLLLKFSGKAKSKVRDGSSAHDRYIYE